MKKTVLAFLLLLGICSTMLVGCGGKTERVVIYTAAEEERIEYLQRELRAKFPQYDIVFQSIGTGALVSKLQAEGNRTECDIFYDLEATNAEIILNSNPNLFYDLGSDYDFSVYLPSVVEYTKNHHKYAVNGKTDGTIVVNKSVLSQNGCEVPKTYEDLLKPEYKGLITMPSPKSSGTGYAFYNGLVSSLGEAKALEYFDSLDENIKEYTTSGSAPIKAVNKGEVAIGVGLLWQCVDYANRNSDLEVVFLNGEASYNLFTMGIISGKETKQAVKDVFDYLYRELNKVQCEKYNPDKIYTNQGAAEISNYPTDFSEIQMNGVFDFRYKQNLLDKWSWS